MMRRAGIISATLLATLAAFFITAAPMSASAGQKFCPPGLAKKGCIPPGQRKKWSKGHVLPHHVYSRSVHNWRDYHLAPPPYGHVYGRVENDILLIRAASRLVIDVVILADLLN